MKNRPSVAKIAALAIVALAGFAAESSAQTVVNLTIVPSSPNVTNNNLVGVEGDAAPGFSTGSFASNGVAKSEIYFAPSQLFPEQASVTLGEIASISYWTKSGTTHANPNAGDWSIVMYTMPFAGEPVTSNWYGTRIGSEPYLSANLFDPANTWNQWSTASGDNQLRFYESTAGAPLADFGGYDDPVWSDFLALDSLDGPNGTGSVYSTQTLLYFTVQTGSDWADIFTGQLDGLSITLTDGSVANVNFEAIPEPSTYAALMALAVLGVVGYKRYRRRSA